MPRAWGSSRAAASLAPGQGDVKEFLVFGLAGAAYAVELGHVREIVTPPGLTEVPRSAPDILGVCSVRGLLVTVVDLRKRLGLVAAGLTRSARILLTHSAGGEHLGLFVDEVKQVVRLLPGDIEAVHELMGDLSLHILGVARREGDVIVILNAKSIAGRVG